MGDVLLVVDDEHAALGPGHGCCRHFKIPFGAEYGCAMMSLSGCRELILRRLPVYFVRESYAQPEWLPFGREILR